MDSVWAWIILLGIWSVIAILVGLFEPLEWVGVTGLILLCLVLLIALVYGSIEFLAYHQAWPFIPQ